MTAHAVGDFEIEPTLNTVSGVIGAALAALAKPYPCIQTTLPFWISATATPGTAYSLRRLGVSASTVDVKECVSFDFVVAALRG
jgi:hypothetical protein